MKQRLRNLVRHPIMVGIGLFILGSIFVTGGCAINNIGRGGYGVGPGLPIGGLIWLLGFMVWASIMDATEDAAERRRARLGKSQPGDLHYKPGQRGKKTSGGN